VILGTAAYMAPEQAKGRAVDKRADIFAFGVVLYEMLTARRLFQGETVSEILASVIKEDPPLDDVPSLLRPVLNRCLEKDPKRRLRDIGDVWLLFDDRTSPSPAVATKAWRPWIVAAAASVVAIAASGTAWWAFGRPSKTSSAVVQFTVDAPAGTLFSTPNLASISPDGAWILFGAFESTSEPPNLWLRSLRSGTVRRVAGTERAGAPFWSPDSRSFAFPRGDKLMRAELAGGSPVVLCDLVGSTQPGTWNRSGTMLFPGSAGLYRVPASGGTPTVLTTIDVTRHEMAHAFPEFLPDGNRFLFFIASTDPNTRGIYLSALDAPDSRARILATDRKASYVPPRAGRPGALLFVRGSNLVTQEFDPDTLRLSPDTELVAEGLMTYTLGTLPTGQAPFWSSPAGALLYRVGTLSYAVNWVDRTGRRSSTGMPVVQYLDLRISPDGTRVAISRPQQGLIDLWQWDFSRGAWTRLTTEAYYANFPAWSADGGQVALSLTSPGVSAVARRNSDGSGPIETLYEADTQLIANDWSRDGRHLLFVKNSAKPSPNADIWVHPSRVHGLRFRSSTGRSLNMESSSRRSESS
jgi:Tol biopolymer transport system component